MKIAIYGYEDKRVGYWDPDSVENGIPGSEECVINLSTYLSKLGHIVDIFMNPPSEKFRENPSWYNVSNFHNSPNNYYDIVVFWRIMNLIPIKNLGKGKKYILWLHDIAGREININIPFDGVLLLSKFHEKNIMYYYSFLRKIPRIICGNGIVPEHFSKIIRKRNNKLSLGYFSNYSRGLIILLNIWPKIKKNFPNTELHICYGRETWLPKDDHYHDLIKKIEENHNNGIIEHGKVGHLKLAEIMENTSIFAYPCSNISETFCITAIKCQMAGCIPVVNRLGALSETIHPLAFTIEKNNNIEDDYYDMLINTMIYINDTDDIKLIEHRNIFRNFALNYTWDKTTEKIERFFKHIS